MSVSSGSSALVVAHPGHELRVYGWLAQARPAVYILTDGSGRTGRSRLASSATLLDRAGVVRGSIFGRLTDREVYGALLARDAALFSGLAFELAGDFMARGITTVAGDAIEGYNPAHDICRLVIDVAVAIARGRGAQIDNVEFAVVGPWTSHPSFSVILDDEAFEKKMNVARAYQEMQREVDFAIVEHRLDAFRSEHFRLRDAKSTLAPPAAKPFYETHGERQVAAGFYADVVRYREHVAPLNDAVFAAADRVTCVP